MSGLFENSSFAITFRLILFGSLLTTSVEPLIIIPANTMAIAPITSAEIRYSFFVMTAEPVSVHITGTNILGATSASDFSIFAIPAQLFFSSLEELKTASIP